MAAVETERKLYEDMTQFYADPLGFVYYAFPWGVRGTPLQGETGPDEWQIEMLERIRSAIEADPLGVKRFAVASGHGVGKALGYNTFVETPDGCRKWGDLKQGDRLFGSDGKPTKILGTTHYKQMPMYRVTFSDGARCDVSSGHLWTVREMAGWKTIETSELARHGTAARQWELPSYAPVEYPEADQSIDPYMLGYHRLGDECTSDIWRLPVAYRYASVEQRRAVLQGMLDFNGWVDSDGNKVIFRSHGKIAKDVLWLARSLGLIAEMRLYKSSSLFCFYIVTIIWNGEFPLFKMAHKQAMLFSESRRTRRWIDSIESIPDEDGMCVTVDREDGLYLANDFIVTHNSAFTSWIVLWMMSTRPDLSGVVTANTASQLSGKTWRELGKWAQLAINSHWFELDTKKIFKKGDRPKSLWSVSAETNSEKNSEAFAGRHATHVLQIYDEASAIPDVIWEVSEGATTDHRSMWFVFGNPTKNTGRFKACFTSDRNRWIRYQVDSRKSKLTNKEVLQEWLETYSEDSDFFRVRVRGEFPRLDSMQFISAEDLDNAARNDLPPEAYELMPLIMSVDVARGGDEAGPRGDYGGDDNVVCLRRGAKLIAIEAFSGRGDLMKVVAYIQKLINEHDPSLVFVDGDGLGIGVCDRLRQLGHRVTPVKSRVDADRSDIYADKRMEMWDRMRKWLQTADIIKDRYLIEELSTPQFGHVHIKSRGELIMLEKKKDIKARLGRSPDRADALAYSFYQETANEGPVLYGPHKISEYYEPEDFDGEMVY